MPRAPVYERQAGVEVRPDLRVSTQAPQEFFGGGQAAQRAQAAAEQLVAQEKQKADQLAVLDADEKLSALETRLLYDQKTGALNRKGKDALGLPDQVQTDYEKGVEEISGSLSGSAQRMAFERMVSSRGSDINRQLQRHLSTEITAYDNQVTESFLTNERDAAVANYHDPERIGLSVQRQQAAIKDHAARNGLPPEWVEQKIRETTSKTQAGVIDRMLSTGQDLSAKKYFDTIKDQLSGSDAASIEKALEEGSLRGESQRLSQSIAGKYTNLSQALAEVDKIEDPKIQDATRDRVKQRFAERDQAERMVAEDAFKSAYTIVEKSRSKDDIPPSTWAAMTPSQRSSIDAYLSKDNIQTDWTEYYNLKTMAASPELRNKFLKTNLLEYRAHLGDSEFKELVNAQNEARSGNTKTLDGFRSDQSIVNDALNQAGIDPSPKEGTKDAERVALLRRKVDEQVLNLQSRTNRKATNDELQQIVDGLMIEGVTQKNLFWFDKRKRVFELDPEEEIELEAKDIPTTERSKIETALKRRNKKPTEKAILQLYIQKLTGFHNRASK